jgi:hypothetical protein
MKILSNLKNQMINMKKEDKKFIKPLLKDRVINKKLFK